MTNLQKTVNHSIPVFIPEDKFIEFILPHLWTGSRGPKSKVPLYRLFHYVLYVLYTGIQWHMLPVEKDQDGKPEIHYSNVWRKWEQWILHGSIQDIFDQSVRCLRQQGLLDVSVLHGDGTNVVAKKGGNVSATAGISTKKETKSCPSLIKTGISWLL